MTDTHKDQAVLITTISLLKTAKYALPFNVGFALLGVVFIEHFFIAILFIAWAMGLLYLHLRIAFDVMIFQRFIDKQLSPTDFDEALTRLALKKHTPPRSVTPRCLGAIRLWKICLLCTLLQALFLIISLA